MNHKYCYYFIILYFSFFNWVSADAVRHLDYSSYNVTDDSIAGGIRDFAGKKLSAIIENLSTQQEVGAVRISGTLIDSSLDQIATARIGLEDGAAPELRILDLANGRMTARAFQSNISYLKHLLARETFQFLGRVHF